MDALRLILLVIGVAVIAAIYFAGRRGRNSGPRLGYIRDLLRVRRKDVVDIPELDMSAAVRPDDDEADDANAHIDEPISESESAPAHEPVRATVAGQDEGRATEPELGDLEALSGMVAERGPAVPQEVGLDSVPTTDDVALDAPLDPGEQLVLVFYILAPRGQSFAGTELQTALDEAGFEYGDMHIFHYFGAGFDAAAGRGAGKRRPVLSLANALEPGTFDPAAMDEFTTPGVTLFLQLPGPVEGREAFEHLLERGRALAERLGGELCDDSRSVLTPQTISHLRERVEAFRFKLQMARVGKHRK